MHDSVSAISCTPEKKAKGV